MTARQRLAETYLADGQAKPAISEYKRVVADRGAAIRADAHRVHQGSRR